MKRLSLVCVLFLVACASDEKPQPVPSVEIEDPSKPQSGQTHSLDNSKLMKKAPPAPAGSGTGIKTSVNHICKDPSTGTEYKDTDAGYAGCMNQKGAEKGTKGDAKVGRP